MKKEDFLVYTDLNEAAHIAYVKADTFSFNYRMQKDLMGEFNFTYKAYCFDAIMPDGSKSCLAAIIPDEDGEYRWTMNLFFEAIETIANNNGWLEGKDRPFSFIPASPRTYPNAGRRKSRR